MNTNDSPHKDVVNAMALIKSGISAKQAAEQLGLTHKSLLKQLKKCGFCMRDYDRRRKEPKISDEEIQRLFEEGGGIRRLIQETGLNRTTLYKRLHDLGCVQRKPSINKGLVHDLLEDGYTLSEIAAELTKTTGEAVRMDTLRSIVHRLGMKTSDFKSAQRKRQVQLAKERNPILQPAFNIFNAK